MGSFFEKQLTHTKEARNNMQPSTNGGAVTTVPTTRETRSYAIALDEGTLVIADSSVLDQQAWKPAHGANVGGGGWCIDLQGKDAEIIWKRLKKTWPTDVFSDGTHRIIVTNDNEAKIIRDQILEQQRTNDLQCVVTVAPKEVSITKLRDAARSIGVGVTQIAGRTVLGTLSAKNSVATAEVTYEGGVATEVRIRLPKA